MKCEECGKEFVNEYWEGGYIDHVVNFVGNKEVYVHRNDIEDMAGEIVFNGNDIRDLNYIEDFLKCFMTWDCFPENFKNNVKKIVETVITKIENAEKQVKNIKKFVSPLVVAMLKEEKIDEAFFDLFDECCRECE